MIQRAWSACTLVVGCRGGREKGGEGGEGVAVMIFVGGGEAWVVILDRPTSIKGQGGEES